MYISDFKLKTWQGQMGIVVVLPALLVTFWAGELNFLEGTKSFLWHFHEPLCKPNEIFRIPLRLPHFELFRNIYISNFAFNKSSRNRKMYFDYK